MRLFRNCLSPSVAWRGFLLVGLLGFSSAAYAAKSDQEDALTFFNNWFVTGDYVAAGVGLKNTGGSGSIALSGVPCTSGTGSLAALSPCSSAGSVPAYPVAAFLYWQSVENTAIPATKGVFNGFPLKGVKLLDSDATSACFVSSPSQTLRAYRADVLRFLPIDGKSGVRLANGTYGVSLGASAGNTGVLTTMGATLVVIYRVSVPGKPLLVPLRSIVIYDGQFTLTKHGADLRQTVTGFYQPSANPAARMTHIVGNGQNGFRETLKVGTADDPGSLSANQPFLGAEGPNWDNLTFGFKLQAQDTAASVLAHVAGGNSNCLSWSAIVASTNVQDSDGDGLLDIWESKGLHRNTQASPATFGTCSDYPLEACVNLPAMGAQNGVKDIFFQVDWLSGKGVQDRPAHLHIPKLDALSMVASVFATKGVALHFDVGNNYQNLNLPFIVPAGTAQGGANLDEDSLSCIGANCAYPNYPALSFKLGFNSVRDGNKYLNLQPRFAQNRKDVYRYLLFAHSLAGPFGTNGKPLPDPNNPNSTLPRSFSGIADRPGGDIMITLGLWRSDIAENDQVGSTLVQAGTLMHELGHNLNLSHGGLASTPNCAPNYPSVMSYLYQTRGLTDANGVPQLNYSDGRLGALDEAQVSSTLSLGPLQYRMRYYAPLGNGPAGQAAKRHCDGSVIGGDIPLARKESDSLAIPDWSNGTVLPLGKLFPLDINFDGKPGQILRDQPDWSSIDVAQIGGRANFGSISVGSIATDAGSIATDAGSIATDAGSIATDAGSIATDAGSIATDAGSIATDAGSIATDAGDEDYDTHILTTTDAIPTPQQCAGCGLNATNELNDIKLTWTPPGTGANLVYNVYRCSGTGCNPLQPSALLRQNFAPTSKSAPSFLDNVNDSVNVGTTCTASKTCYNTLYTYAVTAVSQAGLGTESPYSNTTSSKVTHLFVVANNQKAVYGDPIPAPTFTIQGEVTLATSQVSCSYVAGTPRNAGTYTINCTGPATVSPTNGVDYQKQYLTFVPGMLAISQRPITVMATTASKTYDGTTTSSVAPGISSGNLAYDDAVNWKQTYDSRNAGARTLVPSGTVNDQNGGNNYLVSFVTAAGTITPAQLTITAQSNTKTYDGNTSSLTRPQSSGIQTGDSVAGVLQTYDTPNAGTGKILSVVAYTVNDSNNGANYKVTLVSVNTGIINKADPVVTVTAYGVTYDGMPHISTGAAKGVMGEPLSGLDMIGTAHTNAGSYSDIWIFTDQTGNYNSVRGSVLNVIAKATANIAIVPYNVIYDGNQKLATGTVSGVGGVDLSGGLNLTGTAHTVVGTYPTDPWTFTDLTGNYNNASGTVSDTIRTNAVDLSSLTLPPGGSAQLINNNSTLRLSGGAGQLSAAWWIKKPVSNTFSTTFTFQITPVAPGQELADGIAFVIQNAAAGSNTLGTGNAGAYIGYSGVPNSIAVEFDTYRNTEFGDPTTFLSHVGIQSNGIGPNSSNHGDPNLKVHTNPVQADFADGATHKATITYDGATLSVFLDGATTPLTSVGVNLGTLLNLDNGSAFVGFTAATGVAQEIADVVSWTWN